jgi:hypothetical protein
MASWTSSVIARCSILYAWQGKVAACAWQAFSEALNLSHSIGGKLGEICTGFEVKRDECQIA